MLRLISDKSKQDKCCRNSCDNFNHKYQRCPIFTNLDYDCNSTIKRCLNFSDIRDNEPLHYEGPTVFNNHINEDDELNFLFNIAGDLVRDDSYEGYPLIPEVALDKKIDGLYWYTSPGNTFGCWILSKDTKKFKIVPTAKKDAVKGWKENIYQSPVPLHDHRASYNLKTRMCWFVDEQGWGQYATIVGNKIQFITYPKPTNFQSSHF